jgi:hypothetical protein
MYQDLLWALLETDSTVPSAGESTVNGELDRAARFMFGHNIAVQLARRAWSTGDALARPFDWPALREWLLEHAQLLVHGHSLRLLCRCWDEPLAQTAPPLACHAQSLLSALDFWARRIARAARRQPEMPPTLLSLSQVRTLLDLALLACSGGGASGYPIPLGPRASSLAGPALGRSRLDCGRTHSSSRSAPCRLAQAAATRPGARHTAGPPHTPASHDDDGRARWVGGRASCALTADFNSSWGLLPSPLLIVQRRSRGALALYLSLLAHFALIMGPRCPTHLSVLAL